MNVAIAFEGRHRKGLKVTDADPWRKMFLRCFDCCTLNLN